MPVFPALKGLRQEDNQSKTSLGYIVRPPSPNKAPKCADVWKTCREKRL